MLRRLLTVLSVVISFTVLFACSDDSASAALPTISDVYATDVSVVYDGRPHSISVINALSTDTVTYSADDICYSETLPSFTMPGEYTVHFKVNRSGYAELSSSAVVTITPSILSNISAPNTSFVYDGNAHSIAIDGTLATDIITYSTDGITFTSDAPAFIDVGEYTVYYSADRGYGQYKSSCVLTILPNIYGRYFNKTFGLIVLSQNTATVNSQTFPLTFSVTGDGYIGTSQFSVANNVLTYNALTFTKLSISEYVYKLSTGDLSVYFCTTESGMLDISFDDDCAEISIESTTIFTVQNVNYCESAQITDYVNLAFSQGFSHSSEITEIDVTLSLRPHNPLSMECLYFTFDGQPHSFDIAKDAVFIDSDGVQLSDTPSFTDMGKYTARALVVSDEYLPLIIDCTMVILPDLSGVYFASTGVIQICDGQIIIDGKQCGKPEITNDEWTYNELPINTTDKGIEYDGVNYTATSDTVLIINIDGSTRLRAVLPTGINQVFATFDGKKLTFTYKSGTITDIELTGASVSILLSGNALTPIETSDGAISFVIGMSDLSDPVVIVDVVCKQ